MGSIYKRGGRWWIAYKEVTGRRVCRPTGLRIAEEVSARALLARIEAQVSAGESVARSSRMTLEEYAVGWHADRRKQGVGSAADEESRIRLHVLPVLGTMKLGDIKPRHVRDLIRQLRTKMSARGKALAPRTIRHAVATLHRLLHDCVVDELISANPVVMKRGDLPGKVDADRKWRATAVFERREIESIITDERIPVDRHIMYSMLFLAGVRFGEAAALRVASYDPTAQPLGKLLVVNSYDTKKRVEKGTKTGVTREVPVHPVLAKILAQWLLSGWTQMMGRPPTADDLLIPSRIGRNRNVNHMLRRFHQDLARLGLRKRRQHDARRTFISLALADGAHRLRRCLAFAALRSVGWSEDRRRSTGWRRPRRRSFSFRHPASLPSKRLLQCYSRSAAQRT